MPHINVNNLLKNLSIINNTLNNTVTYINTDAQQLSTCSLKIENILKPKTWKTIYLDAKDKETHT